jgi:F-type H+-transporting ATPase subunit b
MRFWTAYAFIALGLASKAWSASGGEHHSSISDLLAPTFNVVVLVVVLIFATKDKLKSYFVSQSENVANTLERADIKSKEARMMLESQKRKLASLDADIKKIQKESESDVLVYETKISKETAEKISKLKEDANSKVAANKKEMMNDLNKELLEEVVKQAKSTIKENKDYQNKVSSKMLQGLQ